ncbi:unnamed protein product [Didymodactylos carnosus]|uniref:Uncharacterized protein n=1 Tax=Didymodactylos carnosus TaxID=1234261 RepID=A0A814ZK32_9BILA|nr:unnamed protein product [Didymodactylos carnosus]CAF1244442.1 unnamed protein product [Didymodactylos carnosus]CAF3612074.1 unnamed protein product [Didymodactylos carnosus]CAF4009277.1 unnamed protein product [Didymodactylos carnosus]
MLCDECKTNSYDFTCKCLKKLCVSCSTKHIQLIEKQFSDIYNNDIKSKIEQINDICHQNNSIEQQHQIIHDWKSKQIQLINDISNEALNNLKKTQQLLSTINIDDLEKNFRIIRHEQLDEINEFKQNLCNKYTALSELSSIIKYNTLNDLLKNALNLISLDNDNNNNNNNEEENFTSFVDKSNIIYRIPRAHADCYGAIACHNNELVYYDFDRKTIIVIKTIYKTQSFEYKWPYEQRITDMDYSSILQLYLISTGRGTCELYSFDSDTGNINIWMTFQLRQRKMQVLKRFYCSLDSIFIVFWDKRGDYKKQCCDTLLLIDYNKKEIEYKTIKDLINIDGEIVDVACDDNSNVISLAYRSTIENNRVIGVYLFTKEWNVINVVQLDATNNSDCWFTPRISWSSVLNVFVFVEYTSATLFILNRNGIIKGKSTFEDQNDATQPLNICLSNDWIALYYQLSINIHRINKLLT